MKNAKLFISVRAFYLLGAGSSSPKQSANQTWNIGDAESQLENVCFAGLALEISVL